MHSKPEVAQLADQCKAQADVCSGHRRRGVQGVVDEVGYEGAKAPVVGAVPEQVDDGHGRVAEPACNMVPLAAAAGTCEQLKSYHWKGHAGTKIQQIIFTTNSVYIHCTPLCMSAMQ